MSYNQKRTAVVLLFFFGLLFYTAAIVRLPSEFSLDLNGLMRDINLAFVSQAIGNAMMFVGLLFATQIKKQ